ncbi:MAG TPA: beta-propeller fold lactonase family protein [Solirubrobacteraceae bacterium]|nr:beta-propeller fold lactonase family protein [Solirubrobacteraceae bacterium]
MGARGQILKAVLLAAVLAALLPATAAATTQNAASVIVSPNGSTVYSGFNGAGFSVFSRDPNTGELTLLGEAPTSSGGGPLEFPALAISPDGASLYGVDSQSNTLFQYAPASGGVTEQQSYPVLANTAQAKDPTSALVSPDGSSVYVLTYGVQYGTGVGVSTDGQINAFQRNPSTGNLTLIQTAPIDPHSADQGVVGNQSVMSPDGKFIYVASDAGIDALGRNASTGAVGAPARQTSGLNAGMALAISPDGNYVYLTGPPSSSSSDASEIAVLQRNASTGNLTPETPVNNMSGLSDMWGITVSPDGNCVYATSRPDNSLGWFTRNSSTGALSLGGVLSEGENGIAGLRFAQQVTVYGNNIYVASPDDGGIAVFSRNPTTCAPTFLELVQDLFTLEPPVVDSTTGTAELPVNVDAAGTLELGLQPLIPQPGFRAAGVVSHQITVGQAGLVDVPISLTGLAAQELSILHELTVEAAVTFTASGGAPTTKTITIQLVKNPASLTKLRVSPRKFALDGRLVKGRCLAQTRKNRTRRACRRRVALAFSYRLNQASSVTFTIAHKQAGREVRHRCVKPTRKNRKDRRCTQLVNQPGSLTKAGAAGSNRFTFSGKLGGRRLGPGTYVLSATPAGGKASKTTFEITG